MLKGKRNNGEVASTGAVVIEHSQITAKVLDVAIQLIEATVQ